MLFKQANLTVRSLNPSNNETLRRHTFLTVNKYINFYSSQFLTATRKILTIDHFMQLLDKERTKWVDQIGNSPDV